MPGRGRLLNSRMSTLVARASRGARGSLVAGSIGVLPDDLLDDTVTALEPDPPR